MEWVSTFHGVHHLKGGDSRLKISIEETGGIGTVMMTEAGTFMGQRCRKYAETLPELKAMGEQLEKEGFKCQ